jgi:hypothetical protein
MRFRFTIRDLFWLTALIAMGIGWWLDHRAQVERVESMRPSEIVVYPVTVASSNTVLRVLQTQFAGVTGVRFMADANCVVVQARPIQQRTIHSIINKLEGKDVTPSPSVPQTPRPFSAPFGPTTTPPRGEPP